MVLPRFMAELKHRNVYRAAVVYAAVGWALLEAADVVLPRLGLPDAAVNVVLAVVLLCFPLAIVFAWIFDLNTQGIVRTEPMSTTAHHRLSVVAIAEFLLIFALVVAVGYLYVDRLSLQKRIRGAESVERQATALINPEQYRAIAVLPFADMSEAGDQAWFAEGIAEELLHALARVPGLKVTARTSSFAFKNTDKTIGEIAQTLAVQAVLEGSVRRSADRIRITAQLIDAGNGYHIWSESYEREVTDIFLLQDELAQSIVKTLRLELGGHGTDRLITEKTDNQEAYHAFIRGRALMDWASPAVLNESIEFFELAVAADPHYAEAWGHLGFAHAFMALWQSTAMASKPASIAADKALALDPNQSEAMTTKAWMTQLLEWDWEMAGQLYRRALASGENPNTMFTYGMFYLASTDEIQRAIELLQHAEELDPLHAGYKALLAFAHINAGDAQTGIEKAQEALELNPRHVFALMALLDSYTLDGQCSAVLEFVEGLPEGLQREPRIYGRKAVCHALQDEMEIAREIFADIIETTPHEYANMQAAVLAVSIGEIEDAIDILEREAAKRSWTSVFTRMYFRHDEQVNTNPRFLALLERIGLDDRSVEKIRSNLADL
jgi:TolB-like protein